MDPHQGEDELLARASAQLEAAEQADDEARLEQIESLYRTLETELEQAGSKALQQ